MVSRIHYPRVRITTPHSTPERPGPAPTVLTKVEVDGLLWPIVDYKVDAKGINGFQQVTLTLEADLTIEHPEP